MTTIGLQDLVNQRYALSQEMIALKKAGDYVGELATRGQIAVLNKEIRSIEGGIKAVAQTDTFAKSTAEMTSSISKDMQAVFEKTGEVKSTISGATDSVPNKVKKGLEAVKDKIKGLPTWGKVAIGVGAAALAGAGLYLLNKPKEDPAMIGTTQGRS